MVKLKKDASTEEKILSAARNVFVSKGLAGARMQDIANEAGINKALLHYYFRSKDILFEKIFMEAAHQLFPRINIIFEADMSLFEKIERFCDEYISIAMKNPYLPLFVLNEINQDPEYFLSKIWTIENQPRPNKLIEQIEREVRKGTIKQISPLQLLIDLISLTVFPFVAKPMFTGKLGLSEKDFNMMMEGRKKTIPRLIIESIKK